MNRDKFQGKDIGLSDPSNELYVLAASDTVNLEHGVPKAVFIGTGGNLTILGADNDEGEQVTLKNIPDGAVLPIRPKRILATGTTAADIVGLY